MKPRTTMPLDQLNAWLRYDPETGLFFRRSNGRKMGWNCPQGYTQIKHGPTKFSASRLAWAITYGEWPTLDVDHINRVRDDNRLVNLRLASREASCWNMGLVRRSTTGLKGVSVRRRDKKFRAQIYANGMSFRLGSFDKAVDAALAYDRAATYFHGEFAATNYSMGLL